MALNWGAFVSPTKEFIGGPAPAQTVTQDALINQAGTTFSPQVNLSISVGLINQAGTITAPQVNLATAFGFINQAGVVFAPLLQAGQQVTPGLINQAGATSSPTISPGNVDVSPALINQAGITFAPTVALQTSPSFINQAGTAFQPAITVGNVDVSPALIDQAGTAIEPNKVQNDGIFPPTINLSAAGGFINQAGVTFSPTISAGNINISPALISQPGQTFTPSVELQAVPGFINQAGQTFAPQQIDQTVSLPLINQAGTTSGPTVNQQATGAFIDQTGVVFEPEVDAGGPKSVLVPLIAQVGQVFSPTGQLDQDFSVALIAQTGQVFEPTISTGSITSPGGRITGGADKFIPPPSLVQVLNVPTIRLQPRIFAPGLVQGADPEEELEELLLLL